ncbi:hypothetical protein ACQPZF_20135 [Actinosynnema sp. CS-041913]|uniref:hypothetical protein n=1 Tax=Actinosynnema sp. CS-041913 TaxID=3239917 RepID=UPI003D8BD7F0
MLTETPMFHGITAEDVEATVAGLVNLSLVERAEFVDPRSETATLECLRLRPVIREANRHQTDVRDNLPDYPALCLSVLDGVTSELTFSTATELACWAVLSPHCEHAVARVGQEAGALRRPLAWELMAGKLTCQLARFARLTGAYSRSAGQFEAAVQVRRHHLGRWHPEVVAIRREMAWLKWEQRPTPTVLEEFTGLAEGCLRRLGEKDPLTIACLLAMIDECAGDEEAETWAGGMPLEVLREHVVLLRDRYRMTRPKSGNGENPRRP